MTLEQAVLENLRRLPREKQQEVLAFVRALQQSASPALRTIQASLTEQILPNLQRLKNFCGEPAAAVYANSLLRELRTTRQQFPFHPFIEICSALHDALAFQHRWTDYTAAQYQGAYELLATLSNQDPLDETRVEDAIATLEGLGFKIMPFNTLGLGVLKIEQAMAN